MIFDFRRCFYETDKWDLLGYYHGYQTEEDKELKKESYYVVLKLWLPEQVIKFTFWEKDADKALDTMSKVIRSEDKIFCWNRDFVDEKEDYSQNVYVQGGIYCHDD